MVPMEQPLTELQKLEMTLRCAWTLDRIVNASGRADVGVVNIYDVTLYDRDGGNSYPYPTNDLLNYLNVCGRSRGHCFWVSLRMWCCVRFAVGYVFFAWWDRRGLTERLPDDVATRCALGVPQHRVRRQLHHL